MLLEFKDGSTLEGQILSSALYVCLVKGKNNCYYLVNRFALKGKVDPLLPTTDGSEALPVTDFSEVSDSTDTEESSSITDGLIEDLEGGSLGISIDNLSEEDLPSQGPVYPEV